jgi:CcmD family protein
MKRIHALVVAVLLLASPAFAQQDPSKPPAAAQDGFVPVTNPTGAQETIPAQNLVAVAYGLIWVLLFGYMWSVRSRLNRVEREMETVSRRVGAGKK